MSSKTAVIRFIAASLVLTAAVIFGVAGIRSLPPDAMPATGVDSTHAEFNPTFGMEGELMYQLLKAFGCEMVADGMEYLRLNCEPRLLTEEILEDTAIVDVSLDCECFDPEAGYSTITRLRGEWELRLATIE